MTFEGMRRYLESCTQFHEMKSCFGIFDTPLFFSYDGTGAFLSKRTLVVALPHARYRQLDRLCFFSSL